MNFLTDLHCEYHSKQGLIEDVILQSINDIDCFINVLRNNSVLRTPTSSIHFLITPHQPIDDLTKLKKNQDLLLKEDTFCCFVNLTKINEDNSLDVLLKSNILVDGDQIIHTVVDKLNTCGEYLNIDRLYTSDFAMNIEYSRYFTNISVFNPLLTRVKNIAIIWDAENNCLTVKAIDELSLKKIEMLMPVFVQQLVVLLSGEMASHMGIISRHIVWEYQYENEEEANFAIGTNGVHIVAVRNMSGIAGAVLTKTNKLRIIAENKHILNEARSLLEIKRESYMFEDSIVPMLIGKNAFHINDLINKTTLHCIHVPNVPSNGIVSEKPLIIDPMMMGKRELFLFGTRESIVSAKLLLEMEESVKDLRREFETQKLKQNSSLVSSTSSVSKESETVKEDDEKKEEPVELLSWADTPLEESEEEGTNITEVDQRNLDNFNQEDSKQKVDIKNNVKSSNKKPSKLFNFGGGMVFTNSALSSESAQRSAGRNRNSGRNNWNNNHHYYKGGRNRQPSSYDNDRPEGNDSSDRI